MSYPGGQDRRSLEARLRDALERIRRLEASGAVTATRVATRIQSAAIGDLDAHKVAPDPHSQYTLEAEAEQIAADAVAAHVAEVDPHSQYTTEAEAIVIAQEYGFNDADIDGGVAASHYLGLYADGGATYNEALTEGEIDGGGA